MNQSLKWSLRVAVWLLTASVCQGATQQPSQEPIIEGVQVEAYFQGVKCLRVQADRGYAGTKRLGFLRVALMPALELEGVHVDVLEEGIVVDHLDIPRALLNWRTKELTTLSGRPIVGRYGRTKR